jgi:hypothetical protein
MISIGYERLDHIIQVLKEEYRKTSKWFLEYFQNSFTSPLDSRRQSGYGKASRPSPSHTTVRTGPYTAVHIDLANVA